MADPANRPIRSKADADIATAMKAVYRRLERWRKKRKGRERIPQTLWVAAGELARKHGVNQVSRVLRLEFNQLKRAAEARRANEHKRTAPAFVELFAPQTSGTWECVLEVEGSRGKLRIELKGAATAEVSGISRALWEMLA